MKQTLWVIVIIGILAIPATCSSTPGDAALRGGHAEAAANLYAKGADLGDPEAALKLGLLISDGTIADSKYGTALKWYSRACDLGSLPGCHNVGVAYQEAKHGVSKDGQKAYEYYLKSAQRGYMQSQYNIASLYSDKEIKPVNDVEGYKWLLLSQQSAQRCKDKPLCAWILRDPPNHGAKLKSRMSESEIKEAEELARLWTETK